MGREEASVLFFLYRFFPNLFVNLSDCVESSTQPTLLYQKTTKLTTYHKYILTFHVYIHGSQPDTRTLTSSIYNFQQWISWLSQR